MTTPPPYSGLPQAETVEELFKQLTDCIVFLGDEGYGMTRESLTVIREGFRKMQARNKELEACCSELAKELKTLATLLEPALNGGGRVAGLATVNAAWLNIAKAEKIGIKLSPSEHA